MKNKYYKFISPIHKYIHYYEIYDDHDRIRYNAIRIINDNIHVENNKTTSNIKFFKKCIIISKHEWNKIRELYVL